MKFSSFSLALWMMMMVSRCHMMVSADTFVLRETTTTTSAATTTTTTTPPPPPLQGLITGAFWSTGHNYDECSDADWTALKAAMERAITCAAQRSGVDLQVDHSEYYNDEDMSGVDGNGRRQLSSCTFCLCPYMCITFPFQCQTQCLRRRLGDTHTPLTQQEQMAHFQQLMEEDQHQRRRQLPQKIRDMTFDAEADFHDCFRSEKTYLVSKAGVTPQCRSAIQTAEIAVDIVLVV